MSDALNTNLQLSHTELQKNYDFLTEEIQFLRQSERTDDLSPRERFRLKKQIQEAEAEREQVGQQLKQLENISIGSSEELYQTLLRLGYRHQVRLFRKLMEANSTAAFLIYGLPDYGQRWLLNRLVVQYVPFLLTGKVISVNVARKVCRNDASALWRELSRRAGLRGKKSSPSEIAEKVCEWLENQNVLFAFHEVESMPEECLCELINSFWLPLVEKVQEQQSQPSKFKLLMFLIDYEGCVGSWKVPFTEKLNSNLLSKNPIKSPKITEFSNDDLMDWMETEYDKLPTILTTKVDDTVQAILTNSDNGIPERALEAICHHCGCDWYEELEKWLKL